MKSNIFEEINFYPEKFSHSRHYSKHPHIRTHDFGGQAD